MTNKKGNTMKKLIVCLLVLVGSMIFVSGCTEAAVVSSNLSKAADQFEVNRRVVFFNGITDTYLLTIEGRCSINADTLDGQLEVTVKTGPNTYKKHYLGLSDNVSYFVEQLDDASVDAYHYRVIFRPEVIIPDIDLETSGG